MPLRFFSKEYAIAFESGLKQYLRQINETKLLTAEEEKTLARRILEHKDPEARDRMIRSNLRLVVNIAKRFMNRGLSLSDLIAEGNLGLLRAVQSFDPNQGFRFSTYASWWIKQSIKLALTTSVQSIHIPNYMVDLVNKYKRATGRLSGELLREPTTDELPIGLACFENPEFDFLWSAYITLRHRHEPTENPKSLEVPEEPVITNAQYRTAVLNKSKTFREVNAEQLQRLLNRIVSLAGGEEGQDLAKAFATIAGELFPARKISKIQKAIKAYGATAQSAGVTESGLTFSDMIPDYRHGNAVEAVIDSGLRAQMLNLLGNLQKREQEILRLHFGLDGGLPRNLREIGLKIKLTRERVRQIEQEALRKLEEMMNSDRKKDDGPRTGRRAAKPVRKSRIRKRKETPGGSPATAAPTSDRAPRAATSAGS